MLLFPGKGRLPSSHPADRRSLRAAAGNARRAVTSHRLMRECDQHQHRRADDQGEDTEVEESALANGIAPISGISR